MIPYGRQNINQSDIDSVIAVLRSDFLTQGPLVPVFEKAIADYCNVQNAVAVNSATSALHIACLALGVGNGDVVWTSAITFVATANCAIYCGATVDFVDIDPRTYNLSVQCLSEKLMEAAKIGRLPKVVIPVHLCGQPCDMSAIFALSQKYGFKIIEDASHAIGGRYWDQPIGNCQYSDITVFSFHPVKIITTGEGGMAVTNDESLAKRMRLLRSHGISSVPEEMELRSAQEIWNYQQIDLGFNYRMTDMQAALGVNQLNRLDDFVSKRHVIAKRYGQLLTPLPVIIPYQNLGGYSSYHLYVIRLKSDEIEVTHRQVYEALLASKIMVNVHYIPVYLHPYYKKLGFSPGYCPHAEQYYSSAITIPMYPDLTEEQQYSIVAKLQRVLGT